MKKRFVWILFLTWGLISSAADFALVKDGKAANIVLGEYFTTGNYRKTGFSNAEAFAAMELANYTEKITGIRPTIRTEARKDCPNIYLLTHFWASKPPSQPNVSNLFGKLKKDGFILYAKDDTAYIIGERPAAVAYGVYTILRKYAGMRWILPGEDGEYYDKKDSIEIPDQLAVINPSIGIRQFNLVNTANGTAKDTPLWMFRNNMNAGIIADSKGGGGHIFSTLIPDDLFPTRPELYGLYNGKRMPQCGKILDDPSKYGRGGMANQPCTSNPETKEIMLKNMIAFIGRNRLDVFSICNNDSTKWCECEACRKLDPPAETKKGLVSTRYWDLINYLVTEGRKVYPDVTFRTSAYQTFQELPTGVKPAKDVQLDLCVHHRCYLHDISDPDCELNTRYRRLIREWQEAGTLVSTYEYSNMLPRDRRYYLPLEGVLSRDIRYYAAHGVVGYCDEATPMDGTYVKLSSTSLESVPREWEASFLVHYVQAAFLWDADTDLNALLEDIGSRYYGKVWPIIREYRAGLREAYEKAPTHFLYGTPSMALGRTVADPEVFQNLLNLLAKAEEASRGDAALHKKILTEKENFELSFGILRDRYLKQQQEPAIANAITGKIVIDGEFDEEDWKNAPAVDDFRIFNGLGKLPRKKTRVRVLYDRENLYFAVEASDADMASVSMKCSEPDSPDIWNDTNMEFFFTSPTFGYSYLHWVVNPLGTVWDTRTVTTLDSRLEYNAGAEVKTKILPDGWQAEIRMPFASLGQYVPKAGDRLRVNIARSASVDGKWEGSSWSFGAFHGPDGYREILFK